MRIAQLLLVVGAVVTLSACGGSSPDRPVTAVAGVEHEYPPAPAQRLNGAARVGSAEAERLLAGFGSGSFDQGGLDRIDRKSVV